MARSSALRWIKPQRAIQRPGCAHAIKLFFPSYEQELFSF